MSEKCGRCKKRNNNNDLDKQQRETFIVFHKKREAIKRPNIIIHIEIYHH